MGKVMIKILHGSEITKTILGGSSSCKFPIVYMCAKNYEIWLALDEVIVTINRFTFIWPTLYNV